jgi:hypothetical protein
MNLKHDGLVMLGALLGYAAFFWGVHQGFYALVLPGGLLGIGAGVFKTRSKYVSVICGFLALALGLYTDWHFEQFAVDDSLGYFILHLHQLPPFTLIMIAAGTLIGFWVPFRRSQEAKKV